MRYNVLGYNQELACKFNLDLEELLILTQMSDFFISGNAEHRELEGKIYYWQSYSKIISDLPILGVTSKRTIARRLDRLEEKGMIEKYTEPRSQGSRTYFRLTEKYHSLKYKSQKLIDDHQPKVIVKKEKTKEKETNDYDATPFFNEFWSKYPRKDKKKGALAPFKRQVKDRETLDKILEDIEFRLNNNLWNLEEKNFIPQASSYLNGERWLDEKFIPKPQYKTREPITKANRGGTFEHIKPD